MYSNPIIDFFINRIIGAIPRRAGVEIPDLVAVCQAVSGENDLIVALDAVQARLVVRGYLVN